jgi:FlaA1/EpsC-like NDP-sugar epimerase
VSSRKRILIVGAGEAGRMVTGEIRRHKELESEVIGFIDDDNALDGGEVEDLPVFGRTEDLERVVVERDVDEIIIAIPTAPSRFVRDMVARCKRANVSFKIVPGLMEIIKGDVHIEQIRPVQVEDLLGREMVELETESAREVLSGKVVLVTGAGGSIGSEICRQLIRIDLAELVLLGRGENRIFDIEEDLRTRAPRLKIETVISDLRDGDRTKRLLEAYRPDVIYHTAAHKHVHYMERDPVEAVINNIEGTINLVRSAMSCGVDRLVFLSTDKAANPAGVMGATKKIIELYLRKLGAKSECKFIIVRFGNVIGSKGSVIPLFLKQIARGGPVTVSDPKATRYFMTVKEASLLVIRASVIGEGGDTMILDMGEAVNILEMARDMIILSGHDPDAEIPIMITGLREGEKLHEELSNKDEELLTLRDKKIFLAKPSQPIPPDLEEKIAEMIRQAKEGEAERVLEIMSTLLPGFSGQGGYASRGRGRQRDR